MPIYPGTLPAVSVLLVGAPDTRAAVEAGLRGAGFRVASAEWAPEAAEACKNEEFLALLMEPAVLLATTRPIGELIEEKAGRTPRLIALVNRPEPFLEKAIRRHGAALLPQPREDVKSIAAYLLELAALDQASDDEAGTQTVEMDTASKLLPAPRPAAAELDGTVFAWEHTDEPAGPLVLVVDDSASARAVMAKVLTRRRYRVFSCAGAEAALRFLSVNPEVALVVSDLYMPEMTGLQLKERLDRAGRRVPFVLVTATPNPESTEVAGKLGVKAVFAKPIPDPVGFHGSLERILREG